MNPTIKEAWIQALRSGNYKQGKHALRTCDDEFCCLGVLCDIHSKETGEEWKNCGTLYRYMSSEARLHPILRSWAGLSVDFGTLGRIPDEGNTLALLNDSGEYSFSQIADIIEKHL